MVRVAEYDKKVIFEDGLCFLERDSVLLGIMDRLVRIPLEMHGGIIDPRARDFSCGSSVLGLRRI
jgi:hypothetical protein